MKISIIVPTRNRAEYLGDCLKTCLAPADQEIEVIVSDNNSSDDTRAVVSSFKDSRLFYFNTGKCVSMRQNWEFALGKATGDYLMIIGDDDGLLGNGIQTLRFLINKYQPDVINWRNLDYRWPRKLPTPEDGALKFSGRYFFGPLRKKNPAGILKALCSAELLQYRDGANIYHGCVARHIVDNLKAKTGEYFQAQGCDVYASLANLSVANTMLWIKNPVTIGGESEKSHGAAMASRQAQTAQQSEVSVDFTSLADVDPVVAEINMKARVIIAYTYGALVRINKLLYDGRLAIDHGRWRNAILKEAARLSPEVRVENNEYLRQLFCAADPQYRWVESPDESSAGQSGAASGGKKSGEVKKKRGYKIAGRHTKTIAAAVEWVDAVTAPPHIPPDSPAFGALFQWWKVIKTNFKASQFGESL